MLQKTYFEIYAAGREVYFVSFDYKTDRIANMNRFVDVNHTVHERGVCLNVINVHVFNTEMKHKHAVPLEQVLSYCQ